MTPSQARAFHAVAIEGSFTAAARRLSVSQPSVTNQVKQLERLYKVELFYRTSQGVRLTPAGTELLAILRRMFGSYREAVEYLEDSVGMQRGQLRIGAYGPYSVVALMSRFRRRYPGIEISLSFGNSRTLEERLLNYELDVGMFTRTDRVADFYEFAYEDPDSVAIVPRSASWEGRTTLRAEELLQYDFIRREVGSAVRVVADRLLAEHGTPATRTIDVGSREGVVSAVSEGMGGAIIFDEGFFPAERVTKLKFEDFEGGSHVRVVCLQERRSSRLIRAFLDIAEEEAARRRAGHKSED